METSKTLEITYHYQGSLVEFVWSLEGKEFDYVIHRKNIDNSEYNASEYFFYNIICDKLGFDLDSVDAITFFHSEKSDYDVKHGTNDEELSTASLALQLPGVTKEVLCPVRGIKEELYSIIIYLNDSQKWTREQIADWLEILDLDLRFNG